MVRFEKPDGKVSREEAFSPCTSNAHLDCVIPQTRQALHMKRFLFLICGAALLIIAGGRFLIHAGELVLSPDPFRATVQIHFPTDAHLPLQETGLTAKLLTPLAQSKKFVEQLKSEKHPVEISTEAEVVKALQTFSAIERDPSRNIVLLSYSGYDSDNAMSIASTLAHCWVEEYSLQATILPATIQKIRHGYIPFLRSPIVLIPLLTSIAGAVLFFLGWRMPPSPVNESTSHTVITVKY